MHRKMWFAVMLLGAMAIALRAQSSGLDAWRATNAEGNRLAERGSFEEAERRFQTALGQARQLKPNLAPEAMTYHNLGSLYGDIWKCDEAGNAYQRALHLWEKMGPSGEQFLLHTADNLVTVDVRCGNLREAEYQQRVLVAPRMAKLDRTDPEYARILTNLGSIALVKRRWSKARAFYDQALELSQRAGTPPSSDIACLLNDLSLSLAFAGQADQAIEYNRRAIAMFETVGGPSNPLLAAALTNGARLYCMTRRCAEAEPLVQRALALARSMYGEDSVFTALALSQYADVLKSANRKKEAAAMDRRAREIRASALRSSGQTVDVRALSGLK